MNNADTETARCPDCGEEFKSWRQVNGHQQWCSQVIITASHLSRSGDEKIYHTSVDCRMVPDDPDDYRSVELENVDGHYRECQRPECGDEFPERTMAQGTSPAAVIRNADPSRSWAEVAQMIDDETEVVGE